MTSLGSYLAVPIGHSDLSAAKGSMLLSYRRVCINSCAHGAPRSNSLCSVHLLAMDSKPTINKLDSLMYPEKVVAEEKIEKPAGLPTRGRAILNNPRCNECEAKGLVVCVTCTGSGLYLDSIMECQGIYVKVRCLGCGGTGSIICSTCGGRGHL